MHAGRRRDRLGGIETVLLLAGAAALLWRAVPRLVSEWAANPNCRHVALALPVAAFFLFAALRESLRRDGGKARPADWRTGLALLAFSGACLFLDARLEEEFLLAAGLLAGGLGAIALLSGRPALRSSLFPALLFAFAIPLPHSVAKTLLHIRLQHASASVSMGVLSLLGKQALSHGTIVRVSGKAFNVAEACSGLKFITTLSFASLCAGRLLIRDRIRPRALLFAAGIAVAFLANIARLVAAGFLTDTRGLRAALEFLHGAGVYAVYLFAAAVLFGVALVIRGISAAPVRLGEEAAT